MQEDRITMKNQHTVASQITNAIENFRGANGIKRPLRVLDPLLQIAAQPERTRNTGLAIGWTGMDGVDRCSLHDPNIPSQPGHLRCMLWLQPGTARSVTIHFL